jgi:hypothetical protein
LAPNLQLDRSMRSFVRLVAALSIFLAGTAEAAPTAVFIFFDRERSDVTPEGMNTINWVVEYVRQNRIQGRTVPVYVSGFEDGSAINPESGGLAERRAQNVATALVNGGVPRGNVTIWEAPPDRRVFARPDIVEPQNRYVAITFSERPPPPPPSLRLPIAPAPPPPR